MAAAGAASFKAFSTVKASSNCFSSIIDTAERKLARRAQRASRDAADRRQRRRVLALRGPHSPERETRAIVGRLELQRRLEERP